ncbi:MAG: Mrp/NBP35 family ATP-binding protein [Actinomycetota bacterium]|nr:Mrp/NBP35 family ATP-binding protein [Actinomycetota bacterium]
MPTKEQVFEALSAVNDPEIHKPITELDMVRGVEISGDGVVTVFILLTVAGCPLRDQIESEVAAALRDLPGVTGIKLNLGVMTEEQRGALVSRLRGAGSAQGDDAHAGHAHAQGMKPIAFWGPQSRTRVILVASGKGGVGKSSITANLAVALAKKGFNVGLVDADVWGFSQPRMMGVSGRPTAFNGMMLPLEKHGVKIVSMGFFMPEDQPVIWRGPMLHRAVNQFLADAYWGDVDFVLIDMPPGTGDVAISVASFLPGADMVVVTTPQETAQKVAARAGKMTEQVNLRLLGVIENMSYYECAECNEKHRIFGEGGGRHLAQLLGTEFLGEVPLDQRLREGADIGVPLVVSDPASPAAEVLIEIAGKIAKRSPSLVGKRLSLLSAGGGGHKH